jgi:sugar lactone lactonase YvrE
MTRLFAYCETKNGEIWAKAWEEGGGSRHEMFDKVGAKCRTFRDPNNQIFSGVLFDIPDMNAFEELLASDEGQKAMAEDGLKVETMRLLTEFTP